jgi:hypothetical protein
MRRERDDIDEAVYEYGVLVSRKSTGHKPNLRKRWLKRHPKGSTARLAWEESKALKDRFKYALTKED